MGNEDRIHIQSVVKKKLYITPLNIILYATEKLYQMNKKKKHGVICKLRIVI